MAEDGTRVEEGVNEDDGDPPQPLVETQVQTSDTELITARPVAMPQPPTTQPTAAS